MNGLNRLNRLNILRNNCLEQLKIIDAEIELEQIVQSKQTKQPEQTVERNHSVTFTFKCGKKVTVFTATKCYPCQLTIPFDYYDVYGDAIECLFIDASINDYRKPNVLFSRTVENIKKILSYFAKEDEMQRLNSITIVVNKSFKDYCKMLLNVDDNIREIVEHVDCLDDIVSFADINSEDLKNDFAAIRMLANMNVDVDCCKPFVKNILDTIKKSTNNKVIPELLNF